MEPKKKNGNLYIDPVFGETQEWIWTADKVSASAAWVVFFNRGYCSNIRVDYHLYIRAGRTIDYLTICII